MSHNRVAHPHCRWFLARGLRLAATPSLHVLELRRLKSGKGSYRPDGGKRLRSDCFSWNIEGRQLGLRGRFQRTTSSNLLCHAKQRSRRARTCWASRLASV